MNTIKNNFFIDSLLTTKNVTTIETKIYKRLDAIPKNSPLISDETITPIKKTKIGQKYLLETNKYCFFKKNTIVVVTERAMKAIFGKKYNLYKETDPSKGSKPTKHIKKT